MLSQELWAANADLAQACLEHAFAQGLGDGTLDGDVFKRYVAQDAFFLDAFFRAYGLAATRCPDPERARVFHDLMGGVLDELKLHEGYATRLGIDLANVRPYPAARAYTDFLLRTAWHEGLERTIAAMVPCMRLYAWLGTRLRPRLRPDHPYEKWIETYASDAFEDLARSLEGLLDGIATDTPAVRDAYRYAMACERDFFGAAMEVPGTEDPDPSG